MHVHHALGMAADQPLGVDAAEGRVPGVDDKADTAVGVGDEPLDVFLAIHDRAQVEVVGETQARSST